VELTSEQVRAARALNQQDLARASGVSLPSVKRLETNPGPLAARKQTILLCAAPLKLVASNSPTGLGLV
jgi:DNA-binding XRE family transcriptional regulator